MPVSDVKLREILLEYEDRRAKAVQKKNQCVREVYSRIPEIYDIDCEMESFGLNAMRAYLVNGHDPVEAIRSLRSRTEALSERKKELLSAAGYPEDYMDIHYSCPLCQDTGYVQYQKCRCLQQRLIDEAYNQSGMRRILLRENMQTFDPALFSDRPFGTEAVTPRQNILQILHSIKRSVSEFSLRPQNFLFSGTTGTGKTFMCNCFAKELLDLGYTVLYATAYDLCQCLERERFRDRARDTRTTISTDLIYSCDLLIIDDLGTEFSNSLSAAELFHCVNQRILDQRSTLISTNLTQKELKNAYGDRFASRITGSFAFCRFYGPDLRLEKRRRNGGLL